MPPNIQTASMRNCIQLAACSATQLLPMNPELPADLFTACLTTPIKMALRWFVMQNQGKLAPRITVEMLDKIPGMILSCICFGTFWIWANFNPCRSLILLTCKIMNIFRFRAIWRSPDYARGTKLDIHSNN